MVMGYLTAVTIVSLALLCRTSVAVNLMMCLYMWMLIALNIASPDYVTYNDIYTSIHALKNVFEPGFYLLSVFCSDLLNLSFTGFRMISAGIIVFFTYLTARTYTKNVNIVFAVYFAMPFMLFISGIRAAIALSIASYFFKYLLSYNAKFPLLKYTIGILIASSFHYSALFYLLFLICRFRLKSLIVVLVACSWAIIALFRVGILYDIVSQLSVVPERLLKWLAYGTLSEYTKPKILIIMFLLQALMLLCMEIVRKNMLPRLRGSDLKLPGICLSNAGLAVWVRVNYLTIVAVPLSYMVTAFSRLFYGILLVNYSIVVAVIFSLTKIHICRGFVLTRRAFMLGFLLFVFAMFIFYICILYRYTIFFPSLLYKNMIFS